MEKYEKLTIEIIEFEARDVITDSNVPGTPVESFP